MIKQDCSCYKHWASQTHLWLTFWCSSLTSLQDFKNNISLMDCWGIMKPTSQIICDYILGLHTTISCLLPQLLRRCRFLQQTTESLTERPTERDIWVNIPSIMRSWKISTSYEFSEGKNCKTAFSVDMGQHATFGLHMYELYNLLVFQIKSKH